MATLQTIDTRLAKQLQEACALRGVSIIGVPGGWSVMVKVGMAEKPLGTQRTGRVRTWRSLDTLIEYLRTDLGIVKIDSLDASGHSAASVFNARPDVSRKMLAAHQSLKGMVSAGGAPVPIEAMGFARALASMPDVGTDEDFERHDGGKKQTVDQLISQLMPDRQQAVLAKAENITQARTTAKKKAVKIGGQTLKEMIDEGRM